MADESASSGGGGEQVQLSLGFDTAEASSAGKMYVRSLEEIEQAAKKTARTVVGASDEIKAAQEAELRAIQAKMSAQRDAASGARGASQEQMEARRLMDQALTREAKLEEDRQKVRDKAKAQEAAVRAEQEKTAQLQEKLLKGDTAKNYLADLKARVEGSKGALNKALQDGLVDKKGAQAAARQMAEFYKAELQNKIGSSPIFTRPAGAGNMAPIQQARQLSGELDKLALSHDRMGRSARGSGMRLGEMRESLVSAASSMIGIPPLVGRITSTVGLLGMSLPMMLGMVAVVAGLGMVWKGVQGPTNAAAEAQYKYNESAKASLHNTTELHKALGTLSTLKLDAPTKEIKELREETDKVLKNFSTKKPTLMSYKPSDWVGGADFQEMKRVLRQWGADLAEAVDPKVANFRMAEVRKFNEMLRGLNTQFEHGKISVKEYNAEVIKFGSEHPMLQRFAQEVLRTTGVLEGMQKKLNDISIENAQVAATADRMTRAYGGLAGVGPELDNLVRQQNKTYALRTGGAKAEKRVEDRYATEDKAQDFYVKLLKEQGLVAAASLTYADALKQEKGAAHDAAVAAKYLAEQITGQARAHEEANKTASEAESERKRLTEEIKQQTKAREEGAKARADELGYAGRLLAAAKQGADAYTKETEAIQLLVARKAAEKQAFDQTHDAKTKALTTTQAYYESLRNELVAVAEMSSSWTKLTTQYSNVNAITAAAERQEALTAARRIGTQATEDAAAAEKYLQAVRGAEKIADPAARAATIAAANRLYNAEIGDSAVKDQKEKEKQAQTQLERAEEQKRREAVQEYKRMASEVKQEFVAIFTQIANGGADIFGQMLDRLRGKFLDWAAELASDQLMKRLFGSVDSLRLPKGAMNGVPTKDAVPRAEDGFGFAPSSDPKLGVWGGRIGSGVMGLAAGYTTGSALYSPKHGMAGNYVRGALGGAAAGAMAGASVGGVPGAIIGGVAGFIGGIIGVGKAAKEAAKQMAEAQKELKLSMEGLRSSVKGDQTGASIAQINREREEMRKAIENAYQGGGRHSQQVANRNAALKEMGELMDKRISQLKEAVQLELKRTTEDYRVRYLSASGKNVDAAKESFANSQRRELEDLKKSFGDEVDADERRAQTELELAQAAERHKFAIDLATGALTGFATTVRNGPAGFKVQDYIGMFGVAYQRGATPGSAGWSPDQLTPPSRPSTTYAPAPTTAAPPPIQQVTFAPPAAVQQTLAPAPKDEDAINVFHWDGDANFHFPTTPPNPEALFDGFITILKRKAGTRTGRAVELSKVLDRL
jgi:hypothetical protein